MPVKRLKVRVAQLQPGDLLIPTYRTVVRVMPVPGPGGAAKRDVLLESPFKEREFRTFGARTEVHIEREVPAPTALDEDTR